MIALQRADARRFRAMARRARPPGRSRGPAPPVRISAEGDGVSLAAHLGEVVVAFWAEAPVAGTGSVAVPLDALDSFDSPGGGVVTLDPAGRGTTSVTLRWEGGPAPHQRRVEALDSSPTWPAEPDQLSPVKPTLLSPLHEAGRAAAREASGRYAVHRVQLQGKAGRVLGTDGKQALGIGGFDFPFAQDVLVPAIPLFGSKELATEPDVRIGHTADWLTLAIGPWQVWLLLDREGRFPDVAGTVPRACPVRWRLADRDADTLLAALSGLPGEWDGPVTLDLGPPVVARAANDATRWVAEVPLPDSTSASAGGHVQVALNRVHLARALALGFREFRCRGPEHVVAATAPDRVYLTVPMLPQTAVPTPEPAAAPTAPPANPIPIPIPVTERSDPMPSRDAPPPDRNGHSPPPSGEPVDPLAEAESLRTTLAEAAARAARLVACLRQFRKERRALSAVWSSLRQLNLGP